MPNKPLNLTFFVFLAQKAIRPIEMSLYMHHTPDALTTEIMGDILEFPPEMKTGLPRRIFWVNGKTFLAGDKTYEEQQVREGDSVILTDLEDNEINILLLEAMVYNYAEASRQKEKQKEVEAFSVAVATKLREDLARNGRIPMGVQSGYLFIAMAMLPDDPALVDVHNAILRVAKEKQLQAERIDDVQTNTRITDRIIESIEKAEFVVADITHSRPNVFFEAGYAQGIGKIPIYIARSGTHIEFDIKDYPIIFFKNMAELEVQLSKRLGALIESARIVQEELKNK